MHLDGDSEDDELEVGEDLLFECNEDDYFDQWNDMRQYAGQKMLRQAVRPHQRTSIVSAPANPGSKMFFSQMKLMYRRRFICRFWIWRLVAREASLKKKARSKQMMLALTHTLHIRTEVTHRLFLQTFIFWKEVAKDNRNQQHWDGVKTDYETLIAHIHTLGKTHDMSMHACWGSMVDRITNKNTRNRTAQFRRLVLKHNEEKRRQDTTLKDQIAQLTLRNAHLEKELEDARITSASMGKHNSQLKQEWLVAVEEKNEAEEDTRKAREDARSARELVSQLRAQLAGGDGQEAITAQSLLSTDLNGRAPTPARDNSSSKQSRSRFSAISAYTSTLYADAGLDS